MPGGRRLWVGLGHLAGSARSAPNQRQEELLGCCVASSRREGSCCREIVVVVHVVSAPWFVLLSLRVGLDHTVRATAPFPTFSRPVGALYGVPAFPRAGH